MTKRRSDKASANPSDTKTKRSGGRARGREPTAKMEAAAPTSGAPPFEAADIETMLRPLARRHCEAAIAALAAVVADPAAPASARITAATTLIGWAFGREAAGGEGAAKRGMAEQVVRLTWGETETS